MSSPFQKMLGLDHPIIQSPMAGVQRSRLTIAVSNAGALGSLACAMLSVEEMREDLQLIRQHCDRPYSVNFFCHQPPTPDLELEAAWKATLTPYYQEYGIDPDSVPDAVNEDEPFNQERLEVLTEFRPAVVSFHFGLPSTELYEGVKALGAKVICSATTVEEALWLESKGVDAIIAQGIEAGGTRGMFLDQDLTRQAGLFSLLPQIVAAVNLPVIAAGGIGSRDGIAAAMQLGASAVQIGTTFLLCDEVDTSEVHRNALKGPQSTHTALTNRFHGRPARSVVNRLMRETGYLGDQDVPPFPMAGAALAPLRKLAEARGLGDFSSLWSGQNSSGADEIPAAQMIVRLTSGL